MSINLYDTDLTLDISCIQSFPPPCVYSESLQRHREYFILQHCMVLTVMRWPFALQRQRSLSALVICMLLNKKQALSPRRASAKALQQFSTFPSVGKKDKDSLSKHMRLIVGIVNQYQDLNLKLVSTCPMKLPLGFI